MLKVEDRAVTIGNLAGRIIDVDSHEQMPAQLWTREVGEVAAELSHLWMTNGQDSRTNPNHPNVIGYQEDDFPIDPATIWQIKGPRAPGASDMSRRDAVMDALGVRRQLMFPTGVGMYGLFMTLLDESYGFAPGLKRSDRKEYGRELIRAYNDWAVNARSVSPRISPVVPLLADDVDALIAEARDLIAKGIRGFWLPANSPPGGRSPGHPDLDPFWALAASHNVAVCLHAGIDRKLLDSDEWRNTPQFEGFRLLEEFKVDPWSLATSHMAAENFLLTTVLSGVFDRHPTLRFGVIELGAYWLGPLIETMDMWHENGKLFGTDKTYRLPLRPSDYVRRNVRASGFDFEPIGTMISRHPALADILCFASDYPHVEGGKDPIGKWLSELEPFGADVIEKFFVENGQWLFPE